MKMNKTHRNRFDKIVKHIVQKGSPSTNVPEISTEEEADAIGQEGKKPKKRPIDPNADDFK